MKLYKMIVYTIMDNEIPQETMSFMLDEQGFTLEKMDEYDIDHEDMNDLLNGENLDAVLAGNNSKEIQKYLDEVNAAGNLLPGFKD